MSERLDLDEVIHRCMEHEQDLCALVEEVRREREAHQRLRKAAKELYAARDFWNSHTAEWTALGAALAAEAKPCK